MKTRQRKTKSRKNRGGKLAAVVGGSKLALYKKIKIEVTSILSSGALGANDPLPTEKQLAARFGASIGTVRRAMDDLVAEHVVVRQQGRGTFAATLDPERMLNRFWPIFRKDGVRRIPIVQTLSFDEGRADAEAAVALSLKRGEGVYRIVNLLLLDGNPVMVDDVCLPKKLYPDLNEQKIVSRETTMYGFYQSEFGINVVRILDRLRGAAASPEAARYLGVPIGTPLLDFARIAYTFDDTPVEFRKTVIHTERYEYRNGIGR
jgi:GntR family transcriptional regulator